MNTKFNIKTTTTILNKGGEALDKAFEGFDKSFDDMSKAMEEMVKSGQESTTTSQTYKLYGSTKEELLKEVNTYTSKGYELKNIGTTKIGEDTLHVATLTLTVSF